MLARRLSLPALVTTVLLLSACADPVPANTPPPESNSASEITIGLTYIPDIQFAPFYLADALGYFEDQGVHVTLRHHGESESYFGALSTGDEQVVVAGGDEMLQAKVEDPSLISIGTLYQDYPVAALVHEDSDIFDYEDLAGQHIGTPGPFGQTYFGLLALLQAAELTQDDVEIEYIGFTQFSALATDAVDVVMGFKNNEPTTMANAGIDVRVIELPHDAPLVGTGLVSTTEFSTENPETIDGVLEAVRQAIAFIHADTEAAVELATDYIPGFSHQDVTETTEILRNTAELYGDGSLTNDPQLWQDMHDFMLASNLIDAPVDIETAYR